MSAPADVDSGYCTYLESCVGTTILGFGDDDHSLMMQLSDGTTVEFYAEPGGGFGVEVHGAGAAH